ncbi:hypothetical protein [Methylobacterium aerolatum]|uniref:Uncharacterized protein n=1 Tax=Methylobacterium aerolatum TaxID=418708 RepID=A0ABU0I5Z8_9HYPH|nr:hypothetical protein [Methylobacterium aerolatum]MDQ0450032.1 hypothetical protein [Methylobacterium aerolatum]
MTDLPPAEKPSTALTRSVGGKDLRSGLAIAIDAGTDATVAALHGVPVLGVLTGAVRGLQDVRKWLEFRKTVNFLEGVAEASEEKRAAFTEKLQEDGKAEAFGENVLLLLDRLDDMAKPRIIGRLMAAHIEGHMDYDTAMRLCAMVSRAYASDLAFLKTFKSGAQGDGAPVAAMLAASGLLQQTGVDGGLETEEASGGMLYDGNAYGKLLVQYGL